MMEKCTTGIMVLDSRGSATRKYEFSTNKEHNTNLFTLPGKIARNINDDICIIDYPYVEKKIIQNIQVCNGMNLFLEREGWLT